MKIGLLDKRIWLGTTLGVVFVVTALMVIIPPLTSPPGTRLVAAGRPHFWAGMNYPWRTYQDFGTGIWGYSGVAEPATNSEVDTDFTNMAARGIRVVKWRIFNDGRYSPEFDERGFVTGLDEKFFADIDAALEMAERHDIYLLFSLFANGFWTTACEREGVPVGGHADVITDPAKRRSLVQNAVLPLLRHIGRNPRVVAYEIIAEPEWGVEELNRDEGDHRIKVSHKAARALIMDVTTAIHLYTNSLATVESNRSRNMQNWRGLGLDFYTFSWYDWLEPYDPLDQPATAHGVDRPVVIGEFPVGSSEYYTFEQVLEIAYRQGYAGAFGWSYWGGDKYGLFHEVSDQFINWERAHWPEVNLGHSSPEPELETALLPQPYSVNVRTIASAAGNVSVEFEVSVREGGQFQLQFFMQELGNKANERQVDQVATFDPYGSQRFRIHYIEIDDARAYKLNLGIFDSSWNLVKWFDGLTIIYIKDGQIVPPDLSIQALEDPCYIQPR